MANTRLHDVSEVFALSVLPLFLPALLASPVPSAYRDDDLFKHLKTMKGPLALHFGPSIQGEEGTFLRFPACLLCKPQSPATDEDVFRFALVACAADLFLRSHNISGICTTVVGADEIFCFHSNDDVHDFTYYSNPRLPNHCTEMSSVEVV